MAVYSQSHAAAMEGLGTYKKAGATLATSTLLEVLNIAALPTDCKHADIKIVSGTIYIENDATASDANAMPFDEGEKYEIRNSISMLAQLRFFADATYDMRIALFK